MNDKPIMGVGRFDAYIRPDPIQCSEGGIPFNKVHLDGKDAEIRTLRNIACALQEQNEKLREAANKVCESVYISPGGLTLVEIFKGRTYQRVLLEDLIELKQALNSITKDKE